MLTAPNQVESLVNLFHQGTKLSYVKGEFIIRPGGTPSGVLYIKSGLVKAYDITKYGEENLLIIRKSGELLGLTWAITGENRHIIYAALAPTIVYQISREQFTDYIRVNPKAALPLLDMLVDMYRLHSERIMNLEYRTVRERLVSFLLTTAKRFGKKTTEGLLIDVPLRQQDIASSISATRETTGRELSTLERQGLLTTQNSCILLIDSKRLRHYLE
ncbi:MAG TPA: Crp/Fnr family transcriptional regulator [Candidatus Saccharimonadales bacterium]|nr:Crp/Fnr family transcriptional regulator [Candidatus Saccharimonadales bacterium]